MIGALASDLFGRRSIGAILGSAYVFNQLGGASGVFVGGISVEWTGNYHAALWVAVATTVVAILCVTMIREKARTGAAG